MVFHSTSGAEGVQKTQIKDLFGFPSGAIGVQFKIGFLKHSNKGHVLKLTPMVRFPNRTDRLGSS